MRILILLLITLGAAPASACGLETDCAIGERIYRISMPEGVDPPTGAVVWAHGYRGTAAGVMRNGSLRRMVHAEGLALIALEAKGGGWDLPNGPRNMASTGAAEFAYVEAVIADAVGRFNLDPDRMVSSGFSAGGMLAWNLACARPDLFAGFVPLSGTFWLVPPERCAEPVASIVHIHGTNDRTVPLDGRPIGPTHQGKVSDALGLYEAHGNFSAVRETGPGSLRCQEQQNGTGAILDFCLFEGGHSFRTEYLRHGLRRLRTAGHI